MSATTPVLNGRTPHAWQDQGCTSVGVHEWGTYLDVNGYEDWGKAATAYANDVIGQNVQSQKVTSANGFQDYCYNSQKHSCVNVYTTDSSCQPVWGAWTDGGCSSSGVHHYYNKLSVPKNLDWLAAANWVATNIQSLLPTYNNQTVTSATGRTDSTGSYVDIYTTDTTGCSATFGTQYQGCDSAGYLLTISQCNNWQVLQAGKGWFPDSLSCVNSPNKPSNVTAWIQCPSDGYGGSTGGSSPGKIDPNNSTSGILCNAINTTANPTTSPCAGDMNCYAILGSYGPDARCQSGYQQILTSEGNALTAEYYTISESVPAEVTQSSLGQYMIYILCCLIICCIGSTIA